MSLIVPPDELTFVDILRSHADARPDRPAVIFLADGETETTRWTYAALDRRARATAARLAEIGHAGDRVLLLVPPSADFISAFFGCMYAGMVPVPAYPPRNPRHMPRVEAILRDADAAVVMTTAGAMSRVRGWLGQGAAPAWRLLQADLDDDAGASAWRPPRLAAGNLAFLQYTSGSVGHPKGVEVTHASLVVNLRMIQRQFNHDETSDSVNWLPLFHDMGLVGGLLQTLFVGASTVWMPPTAFVEKPVRWFNLITRYRPHTTGAPNFAFALSLRKVAADDRAGLDLSSLRNFYNGAERIDASVMRRFIETFADCGLQPSTMLPCYGLAEVTVFSTGGGPRGYPAVRQAPAAAGRTTAAVGCGRWGDDQTLMIVNPETRQPMPDGETGEIWIQGPHVARGYWKQPVETETTFGARLANGAGPFLRTGDLGFTSDGELFVTGRIKELIIIRGANVYPSDIERTVAASHPDLQPDGSAVFSVQADGDERVVVVQEVKRDALRKLDVRDIAEDIRRSVYHEHELALHAIVLVKPLTVPKTSSGKVQRLACKAAYVDGTLPHVGTWTQEQASDDTTSRARADRAIEWLRAYAERRINSRLMDERRMIAPHIVLDFGRSGLLGLQAPLEAGGLALTHHDTFRVFEQLAAIDSTLCAFVGVHNVLGVRPLLQHGTAEQRRRILPDLASGRQLASFAFTEPGAGSNPLAIAATAQPTATGWMLKGSKRWIGTAAWAGYAHVFVRLDGASLGQDGIAGFIVSQTAPGLRQGAEELTMGMRAMVQNTVHLDGVLVGPDDLLGTTGQGLAVAHDTMRYARLAVAAASLGVMKRALQLMARYASRRSISTGRLLDNVVTRERMTALTVETAALDAFVYAFASWLDRDLPVPDELFAAAKVAGPEAAWQAVDQLMQMLGGRGYIETNGVPQMLRDTRLLRIFEGPSETMQMFIGARLLSSADSVATFIRRHLGQDALAGQLEQVVSDIQRETAGDTASSGGDQRQRGAWRLGEIGLTALWLAAVVDHRSRSTSGEGADAQRLLQSRFDDACDRGRHPQTDGALDGDALARIVEDYAGRIGDVEQQADGELQQLDPMLARDGVEAPKGAAAPSPSAVRPDRPRAVGMPTDARTGSAAELERLIQGWIARRLAVDPAQVSVDQEFFNFGLDSITSVEMMTALGARLGTSPSPTLAWDYPTIRELAAHLAGERPAFERDGAGSEDAEIAALLAAELKSLRGE